MIMLICVAMVYCKRQSVFLGFNNRGSDGPGFSSIKPKEMCKTYHG